MHRQPFDFVVLSALLVAGSLQAQTRDRYIVKLEPSVTRSAALDLLAERLVLDLPSIHAAAVELTPDERDELAALPWVAYVEPDPPRYPMGQTSPYGIALSGAAELEVGRDPITVCVIDSGYDLGHPDLPTTDVDGFGTTWTEDGCGHGTHVTGTIAARDNSRGVVGVAPGVSLYIVRIFDDECEESRASELISAIRRCEEAGADVINMSIGCAGAACESNAEREAFDDLWAAGVLSVAAAGNDGNKQKSYPASYDSVISVGAVDSEKNHADFSQRNNQLELVGPGVGVLSTVPRGTGSTVELEVDGTGYEAISMEGSPDATGAGPLVECGIGEAPCPGGGGQVCLIERGDLTFAEKVLACEAGGGDAAVIYNNVDGVILGTLGGTATTIPSIGITRVDGLRLLEHLGSSATVKTESEGDYDVLNGTSMATPHVAGIAALLWTHDDRWTAEEIRDALDLTAEDLGKSGRDKKFGFGLVRAGAALTYLEGGGICEVTEEVELSCSDGLDNDCDGVADDDDGDCVLACLPAGTSCQKKKECCSNRCRGSDGEKTCR